MVAALVGVVVSEGSRETIGDVASERALVAAIFKMAVEDLRARPGHRDRAKRLEILRDLRSAVAFFDGTAGHFEQFCGWLDLDPEAVTDRLGWEIEDARTYLDATERAAVKWGTAPDL